jgi:DNA-binding response OmpR family regulator
MKTQLFNAIYGLFDASFDENVIESHVSKLRKKLRDHLGFDPIESKRYMGYRLDDLKSRPANEAPVSKAN